MALPVNDKHRQSVADRLIQLARQARGDAVAMIAQCDGGAVRLHDLAAALLQNMVGIKSEWDVLISVPGVGAEIEARFPNKTFVGDVELSNISAAMASLIGFVTAQIPKDSASGRWIHTLELDVNAKIVQRVVTSAAQIAALKTELQNFVGAFDVS